MIITMRIIFDDVKIVKRRTSRCIIKILCRPTYTDETTFFNRSRRRAQSGRIESNLSGAEWVARAKLVTRSGRVFYPWVFFVFFNPSVLMVRGALPAKWETCTRAGPDKTRNFIRDSFFFFCYLPTVLLIIILSAKVGNPIYKTLHAS